MPVELGVPGFWSVPRVTPQCRAALGHRRSDGVAQRNARNALNSGPGIKVREVPTPMAVSPDMKYITFHTEGDPPVPRV
jgi:hypothetical protein